MHRALPFLFFLGLYLGSAEASVPVQVFVLHSYHHEYSWTKGQHQGFVDELNSDMSRTYTFVTEYLDSKRIVHSPDYAYMFGRYLQDKYKGYQPAAIYVTDDNALMFALSHLSRIFPDVPVFFSGINNYAIKAQLNPALVTGVFENKAIAPNLQLMLRIDPSVQGIIVVGDASETYRAIEIEIHKAMTHFPGIHAIYLASSHIDELLTDLKARHERFVFLTTLGAMKDRDGRTMSLAETIDAIVTAGHFVVLSMEDGYLLPGVLGGYVTSGQRQGQEAARLLKRHLNGTPVAGLGAIESSPNQYIFDETELAKARLSIPDNLQGQVKIIHPIPSYYESNRLIILSLLYGMAGLLVIILATAVVLLVRKKRQIEWNAQSEQTLDVILQIAMQSHALPELLQLSLQPIVSFPRFGGLEKGAVFLLNEESGSLEMVAHIGLDEPLLTSCALVPPGKCLCGRAARDRRTFFSTHLDTRHETRPDDMMAHGHYCVPIMSEGGKVLGTFNTYVSKDYVPDERDELFLKRVAHTLFTVIQRKLTEIKLDTMAHNDELTGLPNRALFFDRLETALKEARRDKGKVGVLFIDLDRFKLINDTLGHNMGDVLLHEVASRLCGCVRETDTVARMGGDEFTLLLSGLEQVDSSSVVARKVIAALTRAFVLDGEESFIGCSIGIAEYPEDGDNGEVLVKNADDAMYAVKHSGRNNFLRYKAGQ